MRALLTLVFAWKINLFLEHLTRIFCGVFGIGDVLWCQADEFAFDSECATPQVRELTSSFVVDLNTRHVDGGLYDYDVPDG